MNYPLLFSFIALSTAHSAVSIYVETTGFSSPYYSFYLDEDKNTPFDFINSGPDALVAGESYTFIGLNTNGHPFRLYITDSQATTTNLVNSLTSNDSQTFTLDANVDYSTYTLRYVCNFHSGMQGTFNINPAPPESITSFETEVGVVNYYGNKYTLNGNTEYRSEYGMGLGIYTFKNIPDSHPMGIISSSPYIAYVGDVTKKLVDSNGKDYYYGDLTVYVSGDFGTASLNCLYHGYMGGEDMLVYGESHALTANPTKTLNIYSSGDLSNWELLQAETVDATSDTLFLKAELVD